MPNFTIATEGRKVVRRTAILKDTSLGSGLEIEHDDGSIIHFLEGESGAFEISSPNRLLILDPATNVIHIGVAGVLGAK